MLYLNRKEVKDSFAETAERLARLESGIQEIRAMAARRDATMVRVEAQLEEFKLAVAEHNRSAAA